MIFFVANVYESERICGDAPRVVEAPVACTLAAERSQETTSWIKHLDPVVVSVSDDVLTDAVDGDACQAVELAFTAAVRPKLFHEYTIRVKHLHAMVRRVSNGHGIIGPNSDAARPRKVSGFAPPTPNFEQ